MRKRKKVAPVAERRGGFVTAKADENGDVHFWDVPVVHIDAATPILRLCELAAGIAPLPITSVPAVPETTIATLAVFAAAILRQRNEAEFASTFLPGETVEANWEPGPRLEYESLRANVIAQIIRLSDQRTVEHVVPLLAMSNDDLIGELRLEVDMALTRERDVRQVLNRTRDQRDEYLRLVESRGLLLDETRAERERALAALQEQRDLLREAREQLQVHERRREDRNKRERDARAAAKTTEEG